MDAAPDGLASSGSLGTASVSRWVGRANGAWKAAPSPWDAGCGTPLLL